MEFCEGIERITQTTGLYKPAVKDETISSVCLTKEDGAFNENEKDRVYLATRPAVRKI